MVRDHSLSHEHFVYTDLKLLGWIHGAGVAPGSFEGADAGAALASVAKTEGGALPLVIDCDGIQSTGGQVFTALDSVLKGDHRPVVFWNCRSISRYLEVQLRVPRLRLLVAGKWDAWVYSQLELPTVFLDLLPGRLAALRKTFLTGAVKACYRHSGSGLQRMESSPLLATGIFDAREIISRPTQLAWVGAFLARLAEDTYEEWRNRSLGSGQTNRAPQILAVSLRGSPFAGAVAALTDFHRGLHIVDHVGPKHGILEAYSIPEPRPSLEFLYVGDFILGGTELKVARSYANGLGSRLVGAVALGMLLPSAEYHFDAPIAALTALTEVHEQFSVSIVERPHP
jgi:hypothetical protein